MNATSKPSILHFALDVADLGASVAFYRGLLGVEPAKLRADYAKFESLDPPVVLALNPRTGAAGPAAGVSHFGIRVAGEAELASAGERLHGAGIATRAESRTTCCYAVQDKLWATDPDGNQWEVYRVLADAAVHSVERECCAVEPSQKRGAEAR